MGIDRRHDDGASLLPRGERPVALNPFIEAQRDLDDARAAIEQEIDDLRKILSRRRSPDVPPPQP